MNFFFSCDFGWKQEMKQQEKKVHRHEKVGDGDEGGIMVGTKFWGECK